MLKGSLRSLLPPLLFFSYSPSPPTCPVLFFLFVQFTTHILPLDLRALIFRMGIFSPKTLVWMKRNISLNNGTFWNLISKPSCFCSSFCMLTWYNLPRCWKVVDFIFPSWVTGQLCRSNFLPHYFSQPGKPLLSSLLDIILLNNTGMVRNDLVLFLALVFPFCSVIFPTSSLADDLTTSCTSFPHCFPPCPLTLTSLPAG